MFPLRSEGMGMNTASTRRLGKGYRTMKRATMRGEVGQGIWLSTCLHKETSSPAGTAMEFALLGSLTRQPQERAGKWVL